MEEFEFSGDVLVGDRALLKKVPISISITSGDQEGLNTWSGSFEIPEEDRDTELAFDKKREFFVKLEDGRAGQIVPLTRPLGTNRTVRFQGSGTLR